MASVWPILAENVLHRTMEVQLAFIKNRPTQSMNDTNAAPVTESISGVTSS